MYPNNKISIFNARRWCCRQNFSPKNVRRGLVPRITLGNTRSRLHLNVVHTQRLQYRVQSQGLGHCGTGALRINDSLVLQAGKWHGGKLRYHK